MEKGNELVAGIGFEHKASMISLNGIGSVRDVICAT